MSTNQGKCCDFNNKVLSKIGEKFYLKHEKADVYFIIESAGERIPAHKILLSNASDVFEAMFYGPFKEEGDILIVDTSAEAFKEFLRFFYFDNIELSTENVAEPTYLGRKYNVEDCFELSAKQLSNKITLDNVIVALNLAITYDQKELQKSCELAFSTNSAEIVQSRRFLECDRQVLNHILNMDRLSCPETVVFEACMEWVRIASNQDHLTKDVIQAHMGDAFYAIRFGSMSLDAFAQLIPTYGNLFSTAEYKEIIEMITRPESEPQLFKGCRRLGFWDEHRVTWMSE